MAGSQFALSVSFSVVSRVSQPGGGLLADALVDHPGRGLHGKAVHHLSRLRSWLVFQECKGE